jgi:hypothetical protein
MRFLIIAVIIIVSAAGYIAIEEQKKDIKESSSLDLEK